MVRTVRPLVVLRFIRSHHVRQDALSAIVERAGTFGWDLLDLRFTEGALPHDRQPIGALIDVLPTDPLAQQLRQAGCPTVRLGRLPHPQDSLLPAVLPDTQEAGRVAADHFAERAFNHVAYVGRKPWSMSQSLYEAFEQRAKERGCSCHLLQLEGTPSDSGSDRYERRSREVGEWLRALPKPVGVLAHSDNAAATLTTMCRRAGLTVPEDVALLGCGNALLTCEIAPVPLSSIDIAWHKQGRQAANLLKRLITGKAQVPQPPLMVAPAGVITRRSTDVLAVEDPVVAQAMRFMWDNLEQNLSVDAVAAEVGVPRRQLERAFRHDLKRGVNAELRRKRLECCCDLLRGTTISITDIAPTVGFRSGDYLHASFRKAFGMTPRQYRLRNRD